MQVEKEASIPADLLVPVERKDGIRNSRSTELRRGGKISKLRRLIETASRRRPVTSMLRQRTATTTPAVALPQVNHYYPDIINVIPRKLAKKSKGLGGDALKTREEVEEEEFEAEEEMEEELESEDDAETVMYSMRDDGTGSSPSTKTLPAALTQIEKIAKELFKGERAYMRVILEGGRVETNRDLVHIRHAKKLPLILAKLRNERVLANNKGPEDVFSYNTLTHITSVALPRDTLLFIPEHLSLQLGLRGKVYLGRRTKVLEVTDVNFRNHTVYVYTDLIRNVVVGDTEAPLLRCMAVKNQSNEAMTTYDFANPVFIPLNTTDFKEVTVYLRDSVGQPIPFDYGEVVTLLGL